MIDSKKRLEEIIRQLMHNELDNNSPVKYEKHIQNTIKEILKEFVHKDNLPSEEKISQLVIEGMSCHPHRNWDFELLPYPQLAIKRGENLNHLKEIAKAIRKLIEGKK